MKQYSSVPSDYILRSCYSIFKVFALFLCFQLVLWFLSRNTNAAPPDCYDPTHEQHEQNEQHEQHAQSVFQFTTGGQQEEPKIQHKQHLQNGNSFRRHSCFIASWFKRHLSCSRLHAVYIDMPTHNLEEAKEALKERKCDGIFCQTVKIDELMR